MKFNIFSLLILLSLIQCSAKSDELTAFINQLTQNTWYLPDPSDSNIASTIPFVFNSDGSFSYDFIDIDGTSHNLVHKIDTVGHSDFAYYFFDYPFDGEVLKLYMGVGIGFNTVSQKSAVYKSELKVPPTTIPSTATIEDKKKWYTDTYKESNILTHKGLTLAIQ